MSAHTEEEFKTFMSQLSETNATLSYWTDFAKVKDNVASIEIKLNTLNYLLGKQDLRAAVTELWNNDKRVFDVLQILVACRKRDKKKVINSKAEFVLLESYLTTLEGVMEFIKGTGLARIFKDKNGRRGECPWMPSMLPNQNIVAQRYECRRKVLPLQHGKETFIIRLRDVGALHASQRHS